MARKTFISYKFDEAQKLRNDIIEKLGDDVKYYKGETADTPDLSDTSTENIKKKLTDMMYDTSVTIVIISPNFKNSKWIDWEIEYCLKEITRQNKVSKTNGIVAVIQKSREGYSWFKKTIKQADGCETSNYSTDLVYEIINKNRFNQNPKEYSCKTCKCVNPLTASYISFIEEEIFLKDPNKFIENAFEKSENSSNYTLHKVR
ncbi:hypothetical protein EWU20_00300 [Aquirufa antheringensis]|jgi:hypothetical protein|uniref:Thoeris protein ThsB TIR-like domain-containing protein n=1 Tax=Aquirufa antheringensis TaxID=2516559 RepID=A0A4V2IW71_9BACT|nr:TIR domain-containing protein [Aquirufa antheringensis]TBH75045.1 hypothetical protein EWU20_00300 [Aquirufa antheringensis]